MPNTERSIQNFPVYKRPAGEVLDGPDRTTSIMHVGSGAVFGAGTYDWITRQRQQAVPGAEVTATVVELPAERALPMIAAETHSLAS